MLEIDPYMHRERGPSPAARALRGIRERARRRRSGAVALIQVLLYAALVAVIVGGALGGPALYRAIVGGSEHNTLKGNIDRVAQAADDYWGQYAADRDGRRKIDLLEFCNFANSQFGQGEDIILRTMAAHNGVLAAASANNVAIINDGLAEQMMEVAGAATTANCPVTVVAVDDAVVADIIVGPPALAQPAAPILAAPLTGGQLWPTTASAAINLEGLEGAGLGSTRGVWMMQPTGLAAVPAGTQVGVAASNELNEILIIGGIAPDGTSFCMLKVFDADDQAAIGEYRVVRQSGILVGTAAGTNRFATCTDGTTGTGVNTPRHNAGWPEAR